MKIGEQRVSWLQARDLNWLRFFHLDDHIGRVEQFVRVRGNCAACRFIQFVRKSNHFARAGFDEYRVTRPYEFLGALWRQAHAIFTVLEFFWGANTQVNNPLRCGSDI